jgi:hypothetical protein
MQVGHSYHAHTHMLFLTMSKYLRRKGIFETSSIPYYKSKNVQINNAKLCATLTNTAKKKKLCKILILEMHVPKSSYLSTHN